jgi:hypothetical protein
VFGAFVNASQTGLGVVEAFVDGDGAALGVGEEIGAEFVEGFEYGQVTGIDAIAQATEVALDGGAEDAEFFLRHEFGFEGGFAREEFYNGAGNDGDGHGAQEPGFDGTGGEGWELGYHQFLILSF